MSNNVHPIALFRLSVLGQLASRGELRRGELKSIVNDLAQKTYTLPDDTRASFSEKTILHWYYQWQRGSFAALIPKKRIDKGKTQLAENVQQRLIALKKANPSRSINTMISMIEKDGEVSKGTLSRSTVHRFLQNEKISKRIVDDRNTIERRSFVAQHAGDIWQGDVLHGPMIQTPDGMKKVYLVSIMDDASRMIMHSAFCLSETALDIECVLKQAILKRGIARKMLIDNGPAYRSNTLKTICAKLEIRLVYCRPYEPQGKGKLERFHRTFREQFLNEINLNVIANLDDLNARLWAWIELNYHVREHAGLGGKTPLERWREDLVHVRPVGFQMAGDLDDIFYHRVERKVRKDGTVSLDGKYFEVPYELVGELVTLVIDPHKQAAIKVETKEGLFLGTVSHLDKNKNLNRKRQRPHSSPKDEMDSSINAVEQSYENYNKLNSASFEFAPNLEVE